MLGIASAMFLFIAGKVTPVGRTGMWASGALEMLWQASGVSAAAIALLKTLIEQLCELFAYAALAYSGLEAMILAQSLSQETQRTDMPLRLVVDDDFHHAA